MHAGLTESRPTRMPLLRSQFTKLSMDYWGTPPIAHSALVVMNPHTSQECCGFLRTSLARNAKRETLTDRSISRYRSRDSVLFEVHHTRSKKVALTLKLDSQRMGLTERLLTSISDARKFPG